MRFAEQVLRALRVGFSAVGLLVPAPAGWRHDTNGCYAETSTIFRETASHVGSRKDLAESKMYTFVASGTSFLDFLNDFSIGKFVCPEQRILGYGSILISRMSSLQNLLPLTCNSREQA